MPQALNRAEQAEQKAEERASALEKERADLANARDGLMLEVRDQVAKWREETLKGARNEVETLQSAWLANMTRDRRAFLDGTQAAHGGTGHAHWWKSHSRSGGSGLESPGVPGIS